MAGDSLSQRKAQLDKAEREHLEDVVADMRDRVEDNVRFQLTQRDLEDEPENPDELGAEDRTLVEAIELEAVDDTSWAEAFEQYVTGVGYTIVNRLAALRCMEVRGFLEEEVTVFKDNGLTPAAETLVYEEFLLEDEAILEAYHEACDELAEEIEILFDRSTAYSLVDPDDDTFEDVCSLLDTVPDEVWRADDVLGWVYEYYNVKLLDDLRRKGDREGLEPEDVPPANQFYTPHWVVRMLTDNSLGKLYLEHTGELQDVVETQEALSPDERKNRPLSPAESPGIADFCTYLVPSEEEGEPTDFDHPEELRVIDPACGSGHFLLYAFDVLERIWRAETDLAHAEIPRQILKHNLYGVDLDMRACQLAAFNLYLKGRTRAAAEGADGFEMPEVGIVCADAKVADIDGVEEVFDEVADGKADVEDALRRILDAFEEVHGLGSLLNVRGTLGDLFEVDEDDDDDSVQITLADDPREDHTLGQILSSLREAVDEQRNGDSFLAQDLRSFVRLLDVLAQDYDVALMNPPYGSQNRMPDIVQEYVKEQYEYTEEYYINFLEVCNNVVESNGRIGMLVPRYFMYKGRFTKFRNDFIGPQGGFDFLAEFGIGVLDNATVRTVGTVVRSDSQSDLTGKFLRLHDIESNEKEGKFVDVLSGIDDGIKRLFQVRLDEFSKIPRSPISYSVPKFIRDLYNTDTYIDAEQAGIQGESVAHAVVGLLTGNDERFARTHWEVNNSKTYRPIAKGGSEAWILPQITEVLQWENDGRVLKRANQSVRTPHEELYGEPGLTWTFIKETGRRFGYYQGGVFSHTGFMLFPKIDISVWKMMIVLNSSLYHNLFLSQTTERHWNASEVGSLPWIRELANIDELEELSKKQYKIVLQSRASNPISPYYIAPVLLPTEYIETPFYNHPHAEDKLEEFDMANQYDSRNQSIIESCRNSRIKELNRKRGLEKISDDVDNLIFDELSVGSTVREDIRNEIYLRTSEDPEDRQVPDPDTVPEVPDNLEQQVKDLIHHFAMEAVREEDDGIIPLEEINGQSSMLECIIDRFHDAYGEYAEDRLAEVDEILGSEAATDEAYPNLRAFIAEDLFTYHVERMENTPIFWKLTTSRLVSDPVGEGFACFVDYHSLDDGLFDRLTTQYIEPRKADVRERRSAANRRRGDESLDASEQADAAAAYDRYTSALEQISVLEDVLQDLSDTTERDLEADHRELAADLGPKVAQFREETETRLEALDELRELKSEAWFEDTFSPKFWEAVEEWRDEWIDALEDLEHACEEYAKPTDEPVEAHLADLFDYFNWRLKGSDHYSSTGILFMTYYFEREGEQFLDADGTPKEGLQDEFAKHLATLAAGLEEYKELADEIEDDCKTLTKAIPSDWADRALSEITTAGYRPNHKHGVAINITPLADAEIVPTIVDDKVL
ncbi:BREX-5 system adenine-specific DNA-methyltransferase PglX [Natrialbaceae archaeon A-gly3]